MKIPCSLSVILLFPILVNAYTWQFTSPPLQCKNVTVSVQGSGGQPPYSLLIIPTGASPLPNTDVRSVQNIPFPGTNTTLSFNLNYPQTSTFVAVVSDNSGFGTGGTSGSITVLQSSDSSCYSSSNANKATWFINFEPQGGLTQCNPVRLWWDPSLVNGTVNFYGTVPGGTSFTIPQGSLSSNSQTGTGFDWTVNIAGGTDVLLIGNDDRGIGTGGHVKYTTASSMNASCLNNNSPSSTAGIPAGGSYPTNASDSSSNGSGSHPSSNLGAIIGGVVGAAILVSTGLVAFWFFRLRRYSAFSRKRPVNILQDDEDGNEESHDLPQYCAPEPYLVSYPTTRGISDAASTHDHPLSISTFTVDVERPQTPMMTPTSTIRKTAAFPQLRPVNIIQHDDIGPSDDLSSQAESETIELPPAYSNIRQSRHSSFTSPTPTTAGDES